MAGFNPEFWRNAIKEKLFEEVPFLTKCMSGLTPESLTSEYVSV